MSKLSNYFFQMASHRALRFMPRIVYGILIIVWVISWSYTKFVWGSTSVLMREAMADSLLDNFVFQLYYQPPIFPWVFYAHLLLAFLSLWNHRAVWIARFLAWISGIMIYQTAPGLFGVSIFILLNFSLILVPVHYDSAGSFRRGLNSLSMFALRLQALIIIVTIMLFMWGSMQWKEGSALYYLFHQPALVRQFASDLAVEGTTILRIASWSLLLLASVLPLALMWRPSRYYAALVLMFVGVISLLICQHVLIGLAIALIALPWIDARTGYGTTSTQQ
jgi:hypothetical protein